MAFFFFSFLLVAHLHFSHLVHLSLSQSFKAELLNDGWFSDFPLIDVQ